MSVLPANHQENKFVQLVRCGLYRKQYWHLGRYIERDGAQVYLSDFIETREYKEETWSLGAAFGHSAETQNDRAFVLGDYFDADAEREGKGDNDEQNTEEHEHATTKAEVSFIIVVPDDWSFVSLLHSCDVPLFTTNGSCSLKFQVGCPANSALLRSFLFLCVFDFINIISSLSYDICKCGASPNFVRLRNERSAPEQSVFAIMPY